MPAQLPANKTSSPTRESIASLLTFRILEYNLRDSIVANLYIFGNSVAVANTTSVYYTSNT
jgi:hypothetical protein